MTKEKDLFMFPMHCSFSITIPGDQEMSAYFFVYSIGGFVLALVLGIIVISRRKSRTNKVVSLDKAKK